MNEVPCPALFNCGTTKRRQREDGKLEIIELLKAYSRNANKFFVHLSVNARREGGVNGRVGIVTDNIAL